MMTQRQKYLLSTFCMMALFFWATVQGEALSTAKLYPLPVSVPTGVLNQIMLKNLSLDEPIIYFGFKGEPLNDKEVRDKGIVRSGRTGVATWNVKGSKDVTPKVFIIDGPANMRVEPNGKIVGEWPDGEPVRLLRTAQDWCLVSNSYEIYAWTHRKNLKEIPLGKIVLDPMTPLAKGFPKSLTEYLKSAIDLKISTLKAAVAANSPARLKEERTLLCPNDFTDAEKDHLVPDESSGADTPRAILAGLCGVASDPPYPALKKVTLKMTPCHCFHAQMGDVDPVVMTSKNEFPSTTADGKFKCTRAKFHVFCEVMVPCGEGCAAGTVACPLSCLSFE